MTLGQKLKYLRQSKGLTIQELSRDLFRDGDRRSTISNYENGKIVPNAKTLKRYCTFFEVPLDYFYNNALDRPDQDVKDMQEQTITKINNLLGELSIDNLNIIYKVAKGLFKL